METATKTTVEVSDLESNVRQIVSKLQGALAAVLESLLPPDASSGAVAKLLKIDRTLAWKLSKVAHESDALKAVQYLPGASAFRILIKTLKRQPLRTNVLSAIENSVDEFLRIVDVYANDRASFDMMVSACADEGQAQTEIVHRRAAFKGNSFTLGVQARTQFKSTFFNLAQDPKRLDIASLRGLISFRRLRPNISWTASRLRSAEKDGGVPTHQRAFRQSLADLSDISDSPNSPLIPQFCSDPVPELVTEPGPYGFLDEKVVAGPLGKVGALTCISGDVWRSMVPRFASEESRFCRVLTHSYTPCEALVLDKFLHEDVYGPVEPELLVYSEIVGGPLYGTSPHIPQQLDIAVSVEYLGKGSAVVRTPHIPRCQSMVNHVFDTLGWDGSRFDVYRVIIPYPPIPTTIGTTHEIPPEP